MTVPYTFANATGNISLIELDINFANVKASADTAVTVSANAQPNITSVGVLTSLSVSGNIAGNITGSVTNAVYANTAGVANTANTVTVNAQPNITSLGTLTGLFVTGTINAGDLAVTGNITGYVPIADYANTAGTVTTNAQPNITSVGVLNGLSVVGSITTDVGAIDGNAISGTVNEAVHALAADTVIANAQPDITSVGELTSLTVVGNTTIGGITKIGSSNASSIQTVVGSVGSIVAITDSPGNGGKLAYWDTTNERWNYVFDNSAV